MVEKEGSCADGTADRVSSDNMYFKKPVALSSTITLLPKQYRSRALIPILLVTAAQTFSFVYQKAHLLQRAVLELSARIPSTVDTNALLVVLAVAGLAYLVYFFLYSAGPVLLMDIACFLPDESTRITKSASFEKAKKSGFYTEKSLDFMEKVLAISGLGDETYAPPSTMREPPDRSLKTCLEETRTIIFGTLDEIFSKGTVKPKQVDILVVNCSMFSPVPSVSSMIINHYKMRQDIVVFNLGGMGCSAGLIAVDLAKRLLDGRPNSNAIVVSTEIVSAFMGYPGNTRSMLVGMCLFRVGCSALVLSNKRVDRWRAKYELQHLVRTHNGGDDLAYSCVRSEQDEDGSVGVFLSRDLMAAAGNALKENITTLAPRILPFSEKRRFVGNYICRKLLNMKALKPYIPDFKKAVSHFVIHPGGKGILDGIAQNLRLDEWHMEPSRMTLHRFGNTSSSSIWYVMAYLEAKGRVKKGEKVWQVALGSGIKVNSAVWKSLRSSQDGPSRNVWSKFIDQYPMEINSSLPPPRAPSL